MPDGLDLDTGYVILVGDDDEVGTLYALDLTPRLPGGQRGDGDRHLAP